MDWRDEALLLSVRPHGESAAIIEVFTPSKGRHAGVVRGGASRRLAPVLQPGSQLSVAWSARLEEHLGHFIAEPVLSRSFLWQDRLALAGLSATLALLAFALPERDPHPTLYAATQALLTSMEVEGWPADYLQWELLLLEELGFGLDLSACAVTGDSDDLAYVSPKSGRAVSRRGAGEWASRLLPLPPCLLGETPTDEAELADALATTGFFLEDRLARELGPAPIPEARRRFIDLLQRRAK
ncbi:DNA repair protein RecO [Frigidibacter sp. RF13]|uniref:DNA repair protein RecO n=1 Tax=Frigidibacter sp. RF13 TaxID=2997340 RepID=UPI0022700A5D|nr:DNA repair protein RecO [Frigidibacter sp. RF13]MCY1127609.1 DNA repair protein RecO [Frigidibacter sp. RF13]